MVSYEGALKKISRMKYNLNKEFKGTLAFGKIGKKRSKMIVITQNL